MCDSLALAAEVRINGSVYTRRGLVGHEARALWIAEDRRNRVLLYIERLLGRAWV